MPAPDTQAADNQPAAIDEPDRPALLDLDTLVVRPLINIDEAKFEILHPNELSVIAQARFGRDGRRIDELEKDDSAKAEEELEQLINRTARKIAVGVPDTVWAKLSGSHHWAIVDLFTGLSLRQKMAVAGAMYKASGDMETLFRPQADASPAPTGAKSSPNFNASMEAAPRAGWIKSLRALLGPTSG